MSKDITMCTKASCGARKSCERYTRNPCRGQPVYYPDPKLNKYGSCEKFIANDQLNGAVLNKRHKYYHIAHREQTIMKGKICDLPVLVCGVKVPASKQVEFFEHKLKESRDANRLDALHKCAASMHSALATVPDKWAAPGVERNETRAASDHTVAVHSAEAVRGHIHIVVMAEDDMVTVRELSREMNEVIQSQY